MRVRKGHSQPLWYVRSCTVRLVLYSFSRLARLNLCIYPKLFRFCRHASRQEVRGIFDSQMEIVYSGSKQRGSILFCSESRVHASSQLCGTNPRYIWQFLFVYFILQLMRTLLQLSQNTEVKKAPFEVSETGWGEFEASIRIFFKDPEERPLDLFHLIKLYPPGPPQLSGSLKKVCAIYLYRVFLLRCALTSITLCSRRQWLRSSTTRLSSASPWSPFWSS